MLADLELSAGARPILTEISPAERRRQDRAQRRALAGVPEWFSVEDLLCRPWETVHGELI